jgi:superfamily II DNA or RNA helicase
MSKRDQVQNEALEKALKHSRCGLGISMGVGKTLIGLKYIDHLQGHNMGMLRVLVVAPKLSIFDSWKDDAAKFGINIDRITFTTYLSLNKLSPKDYEIIVLDECHSLLYSHKEFLDEFEGRILGLTGTPPRFNNSEKGEMVQRFCPIIYKYITDEAVEANILNDYHIVVHLLNLSPHKTIPMEFKGKRWKTSEIESYYYWTNRVNESSSAKQKQINSIMRMKTLMNFVTKETYTLKLLSNIEEKCIVFANTQDQADKLCNYSYHSGNPDSEENLEMFKRGNITQLSCVLQLNEGVNIPNLKEGIIMHAYGNERKSSQRIGRLLRLNPDDKATVHVLCYAGTIDESWTKSALKDFDQSKITYIKENEQILKL